MHVLFLPSWYPQTPEDFAGCFFREQAIALSQQGVKVGVIAPCNFRSRQDWRRGCYRDPRKFFHSLVDMAVEDDEGVRTYRGNVVNLFTRRPWLRARLICNSQRTLFDSYLRTEGRPDVIHVHAALSAGAVAADIRRRYGIPYVLTEHSTAYAEGLVDASTQAQAKDWMKNAAACFAVSRPLASLLEREMDFPPNSWQVMPNSVNEAFLQGALPPRTSPTFTFIHISLLNHTKRVDHIIRAFAARFGERPNVQLTIGGDGPLQSSLKQLVCDFGLDSQVRFTGMLSRQGVLKEMRQADAYVLSSRHETFGVVLVEAMALGKPLVATRCGGPEDIVSEEVGILVPVDDVDALAEAMESLYLNHDRYDPAQLRARCRDRYGPDNLARRWKDIYAQGISMGEQSWQARPRSGSASRGATAEDSRR